MNEEMDAPTLLRSAARLIERALLKINTATVTCDKCGHRRYTDVVQGRIYDALTNLPTKLNDVAGSLVDPAHGKLPLDARHAAGERARTKARTQDGDA